MYIPEHFKMDEKEEILAFIESNPFGQLISNVEGRLFSTHLPFYVSEDQTKIIAHLAKLNPQHIELDQQEVLLTIQGPHAYISPAWYGSPGVPTWSYQAVHVYGYCKTLHDTESLENIVDTLSKINESNFESQWHAEYPSSKLGGVVGIELAIGDIECKYKIGQNRPIEDRKRVVKELKSLGSNDLAEAMERIVL